MSQIYDSSLFSRCNPRLNYMYLLFKLFVNFLCCSSKYFLTTGIPYSKILGPPLCCVCIKLVSTTRLVLNAWCVRAMIREMKSDRGPTCWGLTWRWNRSSGSHAWNPMRKHPLLIKQNYIDRCIIS